MLFKHRRHPVSSSCSGVRPLSEAWVATGIKSGSWTGPCGSVRVAARAFVVCDEELVGEVEDEDGLTEHRATRSNVNAEGIEVVGVIVWFSKTLIAGDPG